MSLLPEIIIQKVLVEGIRELRSDQDKVRQLFRNSPQTLVDSFYGLLSDTTIDITLSYPREDSQFPCIAIILRGEQESDFLVGDILGAGYDNNSGLNTIDGFFFTEDESSDQESVGPLDEATIGQPARMFDLATPVYLEQRGSGFRTSYLLQVMTDNQEFTIFLYAVLKNILLSNLMVLERNGLLDVSLTGTDFLPQPSQQPNFIFMRGVTITFLNFCDYIVNPDAEARRGNPFEPLIAKGFVIDIIPASELGTDPAADKVFSILSSTQSPYLREFGFLSPSVPVITMGNSGISIGDALIPFTGQQGVAYTGVLAKGINIKAGVAVSIEKYMDTDTEINPLESTSLLISATGITSEIQNIKFQSSFTGQSNSTSLDFRSNVMESFPLDITEGMFLQVISPITHGAYKETRRVVSSTLVNKKITVANPFSSSLSGARVRVIEREDTLKFNLDIPDNAALGTYNIILTNTDQLYSTLVKGFEVAA